MPANEWRNHGLACAPNFRDVAATVPGLRSGQLFRSDMIMAPEAGDLPLIIACNIRLVIDLRGDGERERAPHCWFAEAGAEIVNFDVAGSADARAALERFAANNGKAGAHEMMCSAYEEFSAGALPMLRFLGERIEAGALPLLVHCSAGKDRTGFVIAMLLFALGIPRAAITFDYLASNGRKHVNALEATRYVMNRLLPRPITDDALATMCGVHTDYLDAALAEIDMTYGSLAGYLHLAGFDDERVARLREILVG